MNPFGSTSGNAGSASAVVLSEEQESALQEACEFLDAPTVERQYITMHGLAGSGKTTVLGRVAKRYPWAWTCTLSGRAAEVLRRKTGTPATTIHSAFYKLKDKALRVDGRDRLTWNPAHDDGALDGSILLLDEVSMVSGDIARDLLRTGVRIVACGDPGQLPPVHGEQFFVEPDITLRKIHRQALDSPIIRQAHWVRLGRPYSSDGDAFRVVDHVDQEDMLAADAIICWTNRTRQAINARVRYLKGITSPNPQPGELVLCLKNSSEFGLFNGAVYTLTREFRNGDHTICVLVDGIEETVPFVRFEGLQDGVPRGEESISSFAFGYGLTCHKAQGSEYPFVILIDEYNRTEDRERWLYTGITRASERIVVVKK